MIKRRFISISLLTVVVVLLFLPSIAFSGQFKVTRVTDGDTLTAEGHDITIRVRLVGIDAPETSKKKKDPGQLFSDKSKGYLAGLVLDRTVDIKGYGLDPYNRILGEVFLEGRNINLEIVRSGMAETYRGKSPPGLDMYPYQKAEYEAKTYRRGIWSLGDGYVSPGEWRKLKRGK